MASAVKWRRRKRWKPPMGTRRQVKATLAYLSRQWSADVFNGLPLMKGLKERAGGQ